MSYHHQSDQQYSPILGYEQDTAPIIIDQPEDNLAVKYINSTLTETIKAVKWSKQVIMVSHNATIPMMADAQTILFVKTMETR